MRVVYNWDIGERRVRRGKAV